MQKLRRWLGMSAAFALLAATGSATVADAHSGALPKGVVSPDSTDLAIKPAQIAYSGAGDAPVLAGRGKKLNTASKIRWIRWTRGGAIGKAEYWYDDCVPFCASAPYKPVAVVTVNYSRPKELGGHLVFSRLRLSDVKIVKGSPLSAKDIRKYGAENISWNAQSGVYVN
jgi:hypothetical protein